MPVAGSVDVMGNKSALRPGFKVTSNLIDTHIGSRIRLQRILRSLSSEAVADAVGITLQQLNRYENGANRVGVSRMFEFSRILEKPISYFFDNIPTDVAEPSIADCFRRFI